MRENAVNNKFKDFFEELVKDRKRLVRGLLIILILMTALILRIHESSKADVTIDDNSAAASGTEICVDIGGAVVSPGVYTVEQGTRLFEVIDMAGGLLSNADTESINRAEYVEDGEKIVIPARYIRQETEEGTEQAQPVEEGESAPDASPGEADSTADSISASGSGLININTASKEELMQLSGIGEAKADRIIEYRMNSRFRKKEDIKAVNGIGDSIYNKIKDSITV